MNDPINDVFIADLPHEQLGEQNDESLANVTLISEARLLANRENAKLSSGPKTAGGRETVSRNSVTHGLSGSKFRVLASESQSDFDELLQSLLSSYAPADPGESELVISMAQALWMTRRAAARQDRCLEALDSGDADSTKSARLELPLYLRYQTTHERAYARHSAELRKLQSDRRKAELGFASQKAKEADVARKQETHAARLAAIKARTDHQLMKNRFLLYDIIEKDHSEFKRRKDKEDNEELSRRWAAEEKARKQARIAEIRKNSKLY
ncbi:MAG TPA: hypothetical protein VH302_01495 [Bryobacteraceae bacterium]|nr:hypothetical protein [Bryobacteraceae bacterium]